MKRRIVAFGPELAKIAVLSHAPGHDAMRPAILIFDHDEIAVLRLGSGGVGGDAMQHIAVPGDFADEMAINTDVELGLRGVIGDARKGSSAAGMAGDGFAAGAASGTVRGFASPMTIWMFAVSGVSA